MSQPLADFLDLYPPDIDLEIVEWRSEGSEVLHCTLAANPWWLGPQQGAAEGRLALTMRGVRGSNVLLGWRAGEVEDLLVLRDDPLLWPYGAHGSIYGNSPLPDPRRFFVELWDLVHYELRASEAVSLTAEVGSYREWASRVREHESYQLLRGPLPFLEACRPLLDQQGARYRLLAGDAPKPHGLHLVVIGESYVVCSDSTVVASPPAGEPVAAPDGEPDVPVAG